MTRPDQKQRERSAVDSYCRVVGLQGVIVEGPEPPDYIIHDNHREIGVEVTEYHQPAHSGNRFKRSQVEAEWLKLRQAVAGYREKHAGLENLWINLRFSTLKIPAQTYHEEFIQAVHKVIQTESPGFGDSVTKIWIEHRHPEILSKYLSAIYVRRVNCYVSWDWNHKYVRLGTSDDELTEILSKKLAQPRPRKVDEYHLIVAGDGPMGGALIGWLDPKVLDTSSNLNAALNRGPYDIVAILNCGEPCVWRRGCGWTSMKLAT